MGMGSMRQRAEIMRSLYSVQLTFTSKPAEGAAVRLEVFTK
jgi:hypothetical protein